jgi:nitroimidazol reductase NimA-like FMN-containing flavoprotein (pyridoxamine 5'-phosphate oxidase superfamily)
MSTVPVAARRTLGDGVLCYLAAPSPAGPHVTPVVYVLDGDRLWGTTGRGTTKSALWRAEPAAAGVVAVEARAVIFRGRVTLYDALDPATWPASLLRSPHVARASVRFTMKNARFFAGYARDAASLPLAWTPPARVVFSVDLDAGAILQNGRLIERWGVWSRGVKTRAAFRRSTGGLPPGRLPQELRDLAARSGSGTLGVEGRRGPAVFPCRWVRSGGIFYAVLSRRMLALAGTEGDSVGSVVVDRAPSWRAARMTGLLFRGDAAVFVPSTLRSGSTSLAEVIADAGPLPEDPAVVRIRPRSAVWWAGWSSGTVRRR